MAEPLIKSINQTSQVKDPLKKRRREPPLKPEHDRQGPAKKDDPKRIIDTYA